MSRKGQAALEFMMTYGWAILVVLAAIGALSYFGILNPTMFTPNTCIASSGFGCNGKPIVDGATDTILFTVTNGMGQSVDVDCSGAVPTALCDFSTITDAAGCTTLQFCDRGGVNNCVDARTRLAGNAVADGSAMTIVLGGCNLADLEVVRGNIDLTYTDSASGLDDTITFKIGGRVKQP